MFLGANFDVAQVPTRRALVCLDLQNDFVSRDGKLPVQNSEHILSNVAELVSVFRGSGDIVWVCTEFEGTRDSVSKDTGSYVVILPRFLATAGSHEHAAGTSSTDVETIENSQLGDEEGFLGGSKPIEQRSCVPGTMGCQLPESLTTSLNKTNDTIITKSQYSAFSSTPLLMILRSKLVTELYLVGSFSNISAYATAIDAIRYGFTVTLVDDCLGYRTVECHQEALRQLTEMLGAESTTSTEFITSVQEASRKASDTAKKKQKQKKRRQGPRDPLSPPKGDGEVLALRPKIEDWIEGIPNAVASNVSDDIANDQATQTPNKDRSAASVALKDSVPPMADDSMRCDMQSGSPPRKRSTGDRDSEDTRQSTRASLRLHRESSGDTDQLEGNQLDEHRPRRRRTVKERKSQEQLPPLRERNSLPCNSGTPLHAEVEKIKISEHTTSPNGQSKRRPDSPGTSERRLPERPKPSQGTFGEGDSYVLRDLVPEDKLNDLFEELKAEINWQKMYHRSGEVPRLVAVQGEVQDDSSIPIYRHPADESPPLLQFSPKVQMIKFEIEKTIGQPLNHVLIQLYRNGEDNISEHSDKTLDIVRASDIVNYSIGAQRTMILHTKRSSQQSLFDTIYGPLNGDGSDMAPEGSAPRTSHTSAILAGLGPRKIQRVPLPHNSLFVLGSSTNTSWLHSIRADKRRPIEKTVEELAFGGERISLTFRQIGTFITEKTTESDGRSICEKHIWGQGATGKTRDQAKKIVDNDPQEVDKLITAFGEENHQSGIHFSWDRTYGHGFDVVNFVMDKAAVGAEINERRHRDMAKESVVHA